MAHLEDRDQLQNDLIKTKSNQKMVARNFMIHKDSPCTRLNRHLARQQQRGESQSICVPCKYISSSRLPSHTEPCSENDASEYTELAMSKPVSALRGATTMLAIKAAATMPVVVRPRLLSPGTALGKDSEFLRTRRRARFAKADVPHLAVEDQASVLSPQRKGYPLLQPAKHPGDGSLFIRDRQSLIVNAKALCTHLFEHVLGRHNVRAINVLP
jgi:hypothetical protein